MPKRTAHRIRIDSGRPTPETMDHVDTCRFNRTTATDQRWNFCNSLCAEVGHRSLHARPARPVERLDQSRGRAAQDAPSLVAGVGWMLTLTAAACNLVHLPKLVRAAV